jgi:hypothetical protein
MIVFCAFLKQSTQIPYTSSYFSNSCGLFYGSISKDKGKAIPVTGHEGQ